MESMNGATGVEAIRQNFIEIGRKDEAEQAKIMDQAIACIFQTIRHNQGHIAAVAFVVISKQDDAVVIVDDDERQGSNGVAVRCSLNLAYAHDLEMQLRSLADRGESGGKAQVGQGSLGDLLRKLAQGGR